MTDNNHDPLPPLPNDRPATGDEIDACLEQTDCDLADIRGDIAKLRESMDASLAGDHERAAAILDALDACGDNDS